MERKHFAIAGFAGLIVAIQLATRLTGTEYFLTQLTMTAYYSLVIVGLCMLIGYAGQISLGHAGFFAIGGYVSAFLTTFDLKSHHGAFISLMERSGALVSRQDIYGGTLLTVHPWIACAAAILLTVAVAYLVGGPVLKLKGHYLAMATLGIGIIVYRIVLGTEFLGASDGISEVPGFPLPGGLVITGDSSSRISNYYLAWGVVILGMVLLLNLIRSRVGRALAAVHGAEDAAGAMGIPTARYKLHTFVLSAVFASLAGVLLTHFNGGIGPSEAGVMKSVRYVAIVAIGGMANLWGALSMSLVLNYLSLRGYFGTYDDAVFGVILILIMMFAPDGLLRRHLLSDLKRLVSRTPAGEEAP
ncbi:MAG: branched-chain amino acid ABC transporter permease [Desulfobacteria bacterium]|nr:branched-chain amino acid ABC transporter permease [Deltaproteobacteria bacterium]OYV97690.1 MAG: branched-chain amino acid ABC transporter permease [Deltaproteobacteria bacterium 37-65-8]HQT96480.1 branched-chain amino acid ABC transporter permease [Thermodesulfobacteriota bacterium]